MPTETILYFVALLLWSGIVAYFVLFKLSMKHPKAPASMHLAEQHAPPAPAPVHHTPLPPVAEVPSSRRRFSSHEGFKSFQTGNDLSVDDIVTGLSRS